MIVRTDWRVNALPPWAVSSPRRFHSRVTAATVAPPCKASAAQRTAAASAGSSVTRSACQPNGRGVAVRRFPFLASARFAAACRSPLCAASYSATAMRMVANMRPTGEARSRSPLTVAIITPGRPPVPLASLSRSTRSATRRVIRSMCQVMTASTCPARIIASSSSYRGRCAPLNALTSLSTSGGPVSSHSRAAARWVQASTWRVTPACSPVASRDWRA